MVFYMATRQAARITATLLARGLSPDTPVSVARAATCRDELLLETPLSELPGALVAQGIDGHALIMLGLPKQAASAPALSVA